MEQVLRSQFGGSFCEGSFKLVVFIVTTYLILAAIDISPTAFRSFLKTFFFLMWTIF